MCPRRAPALPILLLALSLCLLWATTIARATPVVLRPPEVLAGATPSDDNREPDPRRQAQYQDQRALAVEARHQARRLADEGRRTNDPRPLIVAAKLLQRHPPPRLVEPGLDSDGDEAAPLWTPPSVREAPEAIDLLAEARAILARRPDLDGTALLAIMQRVAQEAAAARGATEGPSLFCDQLGPRVSILYHVGYNGGERAAAAIAGAPDLTLVVEDEGGNPIAHASGQALLSWYPRRAGDFRFTIDNQTAARQRFCIETN